MNTSGIISRKELDRVHGVQRKKYKLVEPDEKVLVVSAAGSTHDVVIPISAKKINRLNRDLKKMHNDMINFYVRRSIRILVAGMKEWNRK